MPLEQLRRRFPTIGKEGAVAAALHHLREVSLGIGRHITAYLEFNVESDAVPSGPRQEGIEDPRTYAFSLQAPGYGLVTVSAIRYRMK